MDKEQAIETLRANYPDACYEQLREAVDAAIEALKAQDAAGDTISRQAAIDALAEQMPTPYTPDGSHPADEQIFQVQEVYVDCITTIKLLPTIQPVATDTNVGDTISRQVAVDVLHGYFDGMLDTDTVCPEDIYGLFECIPSAQPETAKRIVGKSRDGMTLWYQCDMCNEPVDEQDNYCRGCGRRLIDG